MERCLSRQSTSSATSSRMKAAATSGAPLDRTHGIPNPCIGRRNQGEASQGSEFHAPASEDVKSERPTRLTLAVGRPEWVVYLARDACLSREEDESRSGRAGTTASWGYKAAAEVISPPAPSPGGRQKAVNQGSQGECTPRAPGVG